MEDHNQYTRPAGHPELVAAVQEVYEPRFERFLDSETEIAVVGGATNAIFSAVMALVDPGDEVVCVEPYFECVVVLQLCAELCARSSVLRLTPFISPLLRYRVDDIHCVNNTVVQRAEDRS